MATISYGLGADRFDLGPYVRTQSLSIDPVWDSSHREVKYWKLYIQMAGYMHRFATATNRGPPAILPSGFTQTQGDRLGISLANIKTILEKPRGQLVYKVGNDNAFVSPLNNITTGLPFSCDCDGGPYPEPFRVLEVVGDQGALFQWGISTTISHCDRVLLSHRWSVTHNTDTHAFTTRTVSGRAAFRLDFLNELGVGGPDQFRRFLLPSIGANMRRTGVNVTVTEGGDELQYTCTDKELAYNTNMLGITTIEGNAKAGAQSDLSTLKRIGERTFGLGGGTFWAALGVVAVPFGILGVPLAAGAAAVPTIWDSVPTPLANCLVRVNAMRGYDKRVMTRLAMLIAVDRFSLARATEVDLLGKVPVSTYVTQSVGNEDNPWVEVRIEWLLLTRQSLAVMFSGAGPETLMNLSEAPDKALRPGFIGTASSIPNTPYMNSDGTRGSFIGAMFAQALKNAPCDLPAAPLPYGVTLEPDIAF